MTKNLIFIGTLSVFTGLFFQNCGSSLDYEDYDDLSSSVATAVPAIQSLPAAITVYSGNPLSLSVVASGGGLSYQWYKDGGAISGETDLSLEISSAAPSDSGSYSVIVRNAKGDATGSTQVTVSNAQPTTAPSSSGKPICSVWYQARNDTDISPMVKDGTDAIYMSVHNYDCDDALCGIRMGVSCTGGDEIRLKYQYSYFSKTSTEVTTPWSGYSGNIQWGLYSGFQVPLNQHPEMECKAPLLCGVRVAVETKSGQACNISYQFKADEHTSPLQTNGAWSYLPDMGSRVDNCRSGCGMQAVLSCP